MSDRFRPTTFLFATIVVLTVSAGVNVLQANRIRSLLQAAAPPSPIIGRTAPAITGVSLTGQVREVSLRAGVPTVVYYFSPTCSWCERNWDNIRALNNAAGQRFRVLGVATSGGLRSFVEARQLQFEVVEGISETTRAGFGFGGTPHTVVVSGEGLITHDWRGAYTTRMERQIEELFQVALPGVSPAPVKPGAPSRQ